MNWALNTAPYLGLPFADHGEGGGFDCWLYVRHVLREERGLALPDYGQAYKAAADFETVESAIRAGLIEGWQRVSEPRPWALVVFNIAGHPWHVGLVVGRDRFMHMPAKQTSCIERLSSPQWANRIEGFYVHR